MDYDKALPRIVYRESCERHGKVWSITACLTRFGGMCVLAMSQDDPDNDTCWQGDNILEARAWVDEQ